MELWCKKSFDWSSFLTFPPSSETFWGCITVRLQFRRQADLALSSDFFSDKTTEVNSWENKSWSPNQNLKKKKNAILPGHFIWWGGEPYPLTSYLQYPCSKKDLRQIIEYSKFIFHYVYEWKYNSSLHYICTLLCLNPIKIIAPPHPKQLGKTTFHFIPLCLPFIF